MHYSLAYKQRSITGVALYRKKEKQLRMDLFMIEILKIKTVWGKWQKSHYNTLKNK